MISDKVHRYFIIGLYFHHDDQLAWNSAQTEIKKIHKLYLNPKVIVGGSKQPPRQDGYPGKKAQPQPQLN